MSTTRQPLLTEEQIQEMLEYSEGHVVEANNWLNREEPFVWDIMNRANADPVIVGMDLFLAFLRGKTKRALNLDRLRADVKAWVDDPDRKWPEWMLEGSPQVAENWLSFRTPIHGHQFPSVYLAPDYPYFASSIIGINPNDYFEEVR